ncbi:YeiH family protein [Echinicola pacifica]|nr:putative sulfate exporter family transporter [Echinicola pacifica]
MQRLDQFHLGRDLAKRWLNQKITFKALLFIALGLSCIAFGISAPLALGLGVVFTNILGNPLASVSGKVVDYSLQIAVVGLGFTISAKEALATSQDGFFLTAFSISLTLVLGWLLTRLFGTDRGTSSLIALGTAICGGSAIAAAAPVLRSTKDQITVALAAVFLLNAAALWIFPMIGQLAGLSQGQFGTWCAIAIHDTSSVVGAASQFGEESLAIATTTKLARALWIIPVVFGLSLLSGSQNKRIKIPYFIGLFILAVVLNSYFPALTGFRPYIQQGSHLLMTLALFLIGAGMNWKVLSTGGLRILTQATLLWVIVAGVSLWAIIHFF